MKNKIGLECPMATGHEGIEGKALAVETICVSCGKTIDSGKAVVSINVKNRELRHVACADHEKLKSKKLKELADAVKKI